MTVASLAQAYTFGCIAAGGLMAKNAQRGGGNSETVLLPGAMSLLTIPAAAAAAEVAKQHFEHGCTEGQDSGYDTEVGSVQRCYCSHTLCFDWKCLHGTHWW